MTSRVQKGGSIFRPTKVRPRPLNSVNESDTGPSLSQYTASPSPTPAKRVSILAVNTGPTQHSIIEGIETTEKSDVTNRIHLGADPIPIATPAPLPINETHAVAGPAVSVAAIEPPAPLPLSPPQSDITPIPDPPASPIHHEPESHPTVETEPDPTVDSGADLSSSQPQPDQQTKKPRTIKPSKKPRKRIDKANEDSHDSERQPKRRKVSGRTKKTPPPPFDPNAAPGEELDPTVITMSVLCDDMGTGRISKRAMEVQNNHVAWKAQQKAAREGMKVQIEQMKTASISETNSNPPAPVPAQPSLPIDGAGPSRSQEDFDYTQAVSASRYNVQVRIGPNGETIIDEESLVVDREEDHGTENYTHVIESDLTKFTNSGSYSRRYRGSRWSKEETQMFFDALSQYGENYELIAYALPGRDRKACKNKFKAEDKKNPEKVNYYLANRTPMDITALGRMTGRDFSGPLPEIRTPAPQSIISPDISATPKESQTGNDSTSHLPDNRAPSKKRNAKTANKDDNALIIGTIDTFES